MQKTLLLSTILFPLFLSVNACKPQQNFNQDSNTETMYSPKITIDELVKTNPTIIKTEHGDQTMYAVIIYTDDVASLKEQGILVQSESKGFVTALIQKEDLEKINQNQSIKSVQIPQTDYPTNDQLIK